MMQNSFTFFAAISHGLHGFLPYFSQKPSRNLTESPPPRSHAWSLMPPSIRIAKTRVLWENNNPFDKMGDWRSGSAGALQAQGQRFKSVIAHHKTLT